MVNTTLFTKGEPDYQRKQIVQSLSQARLTQYVHDAEDKIIRSLQLTYLEALNPLLACFELFSGLQPNYPTIAEFDAANNVAACRFFPNISYAPNPLTWSGIEPFIPPIMHGILTNDNSTALADLQGLNDLLLAKEEAGYKTYAMSLIAAQRVQASHLQNVGFFNPIAEMILEECDDFQNYLEEHWIDYPEATIEDPNSISVPPAMIIDPAELAKFEATLTAIKSYRTASIENITSTLVLELASSGKNLIQWVKQRCNRGSGVGSKALMMNKAVECHLAQLNALDFCRGLE